MQINHKRLFSCDKNKTLSIKWLYSSLSKHLIQCIEEKIN